MANIGIFYGSLTGKTAQVANQIAEKLGVPASDVYNVGKTAPSETGKYDLLLLGSSTWGAGDLERDWFDFLDGLQSLDLKGKKIGIFGCGDVSRSETFCSAVGTIYKRLRDTGAEFIGDFPAGCYEFEHSDAIIDGKCVGLLLDQVNHANLTPGRVDQWCETIKNS